MRQDQQARRKPHGPKRLGAACAMLLTCALASPGNAAAEGEAASLRLCADPTNPPFSSNQPNNPGAYLEIGMAIARALNRTPEPVWELTYYGKHATRETLLAGKCDMFVCIPADPGFMGRSVLRSTPILPAGFALVAPKGKHYTTIAALKGLRVAVQQGTPPQSVLAAHDEVTAQTYLDPETAMQALADGKADAAFIWQQSAGYLNHAHLHDAYQVTPVAGDGMQYQVAIGFAGKDAALRDQVNAILPALRGVIDAYAAKYGFPVATPVKLAAAAAPEYLGLVRRADFSGPAAGVVLVADDPTSDDQKSAADFVASGRGPADAAFTAATGAAAAAEGRTIFNGTCNHCHGPDAIQSVRKINLRLLKHRYGGMMDQVYHYTVTHGRESKGMPNWSGVFTEQDFAKMLAFLHTVQTDESAAN